MAQIYTRLKRLPILPEYIAVFPKQSASQALGHKKPGRHVRVQIELRRASQRKNQYATKMLVCKDDHG